VFACRDYTLLRNCSSVSFCRQSKSLQDSLFDIVQGGVKVAIPAAQAIFDAAVPVAGRARDVLWSATTQGAEDAVPAAKAIFDAAALVAGQARDVIWAATKQGAKVAVPAATVIFDAAGERLQEALR